MAEPDKFNIILLGEVNVGKTSILERFALDQYNAVHQIAEQQFIKDYPEYNASVALLDTAGQERFHTITSTYYKDAHSAIIVYDVNNPDTLEAIPAIIRELECFRQGIPMVLVGNKSDLENDCDATKVTDYEAKYSLKHMFCSCRKGEGVKEIFDFIVKETHDQMTAKPKVDAGPKIVKADDSPSGGKKPKKPKDPKKHGCTLL
ncbi:Rab family GTPase [Pelomyxa schiedti]|nr:Rab family GTPase [Pelomyxa schiedti]